MKTKYEVIRIFVLIIPMRRLIYTTILCFLTVCVKSQSIVPNLVIRKTAGPILLDGLINESSWSKADFASDFRMCYPNDTACSVWPTEVRVLFDDQNIYFAFRCFQKKSDYIIQSLKRDFESGSTDVFNIVLDPFKDGLNGFVFSVNPYNVQREGTIFEGTNFSLIWDNKWRSEVKNYDDYWEAEVSIPFKSLRYKNTNKIESNVWGINFVRTKVKDFEVNAWSPVPSIFFPLNLAFVGQLIWEDPPPGSSKNISLIPYVNVGFNKDYKRDNDLNLIGTQQKYPANVGADAKIAITPGLNLDLTVNPDFSQVEVDAQIANVSRFELFYPETRQFFIENQDLFGRFGFPSTRPFFSRRLGISVNPNTGINERTTILGGARLNGKINNHLRLGLLNMAIKEKKWDSLHVVPGNNVSVLALQHKLFSRSTLAGIFINKQNYISKENKELAGDFLSYNRIAGLEFNLFSKDSKWVGESYYHLSFSPVKNGTGSSYAVYISRMERLFEIRLGHNVVDSFYKAEAGFVPRTGVRQFSSGLSLYNWPKNSKKIRKYNLTIDHQHTTGWKWNNLDYSITPYLGIEFNEQSYISLGLIYEYIYLYNKFDPTGGLIKPNELQLPTGEYVNRKFWLQANTGTSTSLQGSINIKTGKHFKGDQTNISGSLLYRIQPIGSLSVRADYYHISQSNPYPSADFILLGPRADISFRRDLFFSTFFQYNTQINNFNINARVQWRFAPVSDVYLVYTDNSFAEETNNKVGFFTPKNRAIVLKAVYWLNL